MGLKKREIRCSEIEYLGFNTLTARRIFHGLPKAPTWIFHYTMPVTGDPHGSQRVKVNEKRLQIDNDKIQPILEFPKRKNIKQLPRLIG